MAWNECFQMYGTFAVFASALASAHIHIGENE